MPSVGKRDDVGKRKFYSSFCTPDSSLPDMEAVLGNRCDLDFFLFFLFYQFYPILVLLYSSYKHVITYTCVVCNINVISKIFFSYKFITCNIVSLLSKNIPYFSYKCNSALFSMIPCIDDSCAFSSCTVTVRLIEDQE